jgi:hypothetical protein
VHALEEVRGGIDVARRQVQEDLLRVVLVAEQLLQLFVVRVAARDRLLEDRRVRGDADDGER